MIGLIELPSRGEKPDLIKLSHHHDQYASHHIYQLITVHDTQEHNKNVFDTF